MIPANYSTISFPSLGIEVNPGRTLALTTNLSRTLLSPVIKSIAFIRIPPR